MRAQRRSASGDEYATSIADIGAAVHNATLSATGLVRSVDARRTWRI